jgi:hypothetical protein
MHENTFEVRHLKRGKIKQSFWNLFTKGLQENIFAAKTSKTSSTPHVTRFYYFSLQVAYHTKIGFFGIKKRLKLSRLGTCKTEVKNFVTLSLYITDDLPSEEQTVTMALFFPCSGSCSSV